MYRILYFLVLIIIPAIFGWWLFIPAALLAVYLTRLPHEIIWAAVLLDQLYYFGESFWAKYPLTLFSVALFALALFLNSKIYWRKVI